MSFAALSPPCGAVSAMWIFKVNSVAEESLVEVAHAVHNYCIHKSPLCTLNCWD